MYAIAWVAVGLSGCGSSSVKSTAQHGGSPGASTSSSSGASTSSSSASGAPLHLATLPCAQIVTPQDVSQAIGRAATQITPSGTAPNVSLCVFEPAGSTSGDIQIQVLFNNGSAPEGPMTRTECAPLGDANRCGTSGDTTQETVYWRGQQFSVTLLGHDLPISALQTLSSVVFQAVQKDAHEAAQHPPLALQAQDMAAQKRIYDAISQHIIGCENQASVDAISAAIANCPNLGLSADFQLSVGQQQGAYTLTSTSQSGDRFVFSEAPDGSAVRTCTPRGRGGCGADGTWSPP